MSVQQATDGEGGAGLAFTKGMANKLKGETDPSSFTTPAAALRSYSQTAAGKTFSFSHPSTD